MTEILEQLEINQTFFIQFTLFALFFFILSGVYLKPFQKIIEKRNKKLSDDIHSASELLKSIDEKLVQYEQALARARKDAQVQYEAVVTEARTKESEILQAAKDELKKDFQKATLALQDEKLKVESELKLQVTAMSDAIAQKILTGK